MIESHPEEIEDLDLGLRFGVARHWALAARDVADQSHVVFAAEVWDFIESNTTLGVPVVDGSVRYFFTEKPDKPVEEYAFLAPVLSKDAGRLKSDDFRQGYAKGDAPFVAQYREGSRAIYFPEDLLSDVGKGIIMLHEATHAKNDLEKRYDRGNPDSHWLEEADVYVFEFDLLSGLGGEQYDNLVQRAKVQIEDKRDGNRVFMPWINEAEAHSVWSSMFGDKLTSKESALWTGVAAMNAFWGYLEQNVSSPKEEFANYLKNTQAKPKS